MQVLHGRPIFVADHVWRLPIEDAFAEVALPHALNWSRPGAVFRLSHRRERARCYEIVLREGAPADLVRHVDGALLVDLWSDLVLPRCVALRGSRSSDKRTDRLPARGGEPRRHLGVVVTQTRVGEVLPPRRSSMASRTSRAEPSTAARIRAGPPGGTSPAVTDANLASTSARLNRSCMEPR